MFTVRHFISSDFTSPRQARFSTEEPKNALIAVRAKDHCFYIDQDDRESKRTFSFVELVLNLAETSAPQGGPLVAISN